MRDADGEHASQLPAAAQQADVTRVSPGPPESREVGIVSLFCGAGGLDLGFRDAGFRIQTAIDVSEAAIRTHKRNFKRTAAVARDLTEIGAPGVLDEVRQSIETGSRVGVIGGPPCQGFSRANTSAGPDDPRNQLPLLFLDSIAALQEDYTVEFVVFENVLGLRDKKHRSLLDQLISKMEDQGFDTSELVLNATDYGVPQSRQRLLLVGMRSGCGYGDVSPRRRRGRLTVRDAISGLPQPTFFRRDLRPDQIPFHPNHWTMQPKSARFRDGSTASRSGRSFKTLAWDEPSPTVAYGHREIHVHPTGTRRLSIYEALQLQGFPSSFVLEGNLSEQVDQVSNAVPPPVARSVAKAVRRSITTAA